jgi:outer membrane protein OmpA-like peptidoglycan-associated protein
MKITIAAGARPNFIKIAPIIKAIEDEKGEEIDLYTAGLKIYVTVDSRMQQYAEEAVEEHLSNLSTITTEKEIKAPIGLAVKMEIGSVLPMKRLNFDFAKSSLRKADMIELDKIVLFMKANPTIILEFSSYTDSRGNDNFNMELSRKRTETTLNYIKSKGIKKESILGKWYGESQLVNECGNDSNCTEEQHQENRRTEIKIVSL